MADAPEAAPPPRKKGKLKLILIGVAAVAVLGGGGVAAGMYVGGGAKKPAEDPNRPKLVMKDGKTAPAGAGQGGIAPSDAVLYKASYLPMDQTFTSNVRDSDSIMQVGLGVSTFYDDRVLDAVKRDDMPIRSAVLMTLADQDAAAVATPEGKKALRKALKDAINQVLVQKEGFGGIDDVYFTSLIIQ